MTTHVLLIDDHPLFRKGLAQLVSAGAGLELAGDASDGASGIVLAQRLDPDLILIDLNMKPMNGIQTLRGLKGAGLRARCVMLTVSDDERNVLDAMRAGADGYLLKDMEPEELYAQISVAMTGAVVLGSSIAGLLAHALATPQATPDLTPEAVDLTGRECEILARVAAGLSNKEIARELGISDATVKVHLKNVLRKLKLKSRLEAAVWSFKHPQFGGSPAT